MHIPVEGAEPESVLRDVYRQSRMARTIAFVHRT